MVAEGRHLPAELAVLEVIREPGESGWWLNSRGTKTGVVDLEASPDGYRTVRRLLPDEIQETLADFYADPRVTKGVFDLVLWDSSSSRMRFIEVKCPHWDRPTEEQGLFADWAAQRGIETEIVEWEFDTDAL